MDAGGCCCWGFVVGARRMRKESNDRIGSLVGRRIRLSVTRRTNGIWNVEC
jgi:hypothetical protein